MPKRARKLKPIPEFRSHEEAGEFWTTHDTTEYLDWSDPRRRSPTSACSPRRRGQSFEVGPRPGSCRAFAAEYSWRCAPRRRLMSHGR
jgi:hypothetical protein